MPIINLADRVRRAALNPDKIRAETDRLSRAPFVECLNDLLSAQPTLESLKAFADRSPDRWSQAVAIMARLAGYHDKLEITGNLTVDVRRMSDSQLVAALCEIEGKAESVVTSQPLAPLPRDRSLVVISRDSLLAL